jgi:processive 1,2-diacylglycerol beta-glucosyltransferase
MIRLHHAERGTLIGTITDEQLQFLMDELEEESSEDRDYYISTDTVDMLEENGGDSELVALLRSAVDGADGIDIRWSRS